MRSPRRRYMLYIVRCADTTLYTGIAVDLQRRLLEHNTSTRGAKYTRSRRPVRLVYAQAYRSRGQAQRAEAAIKKLSRLEKFQFLRRKRLVKRATVNKN